MLLTYANGSSSARGERGDLWRTPLSTDADGGSRSSHGHGDGLQAQISGHLEATGPHRALYPTPAASEYGSSGNGTAANKASRGRPSLGTMAKRDAFPDAPRPTRLETHGLFPTPAARLGRDHAGGADAKRYPNPARSSDLDDAVAYLGTLGFDDAEEEEAPEGLWPTPRAADWRGSGDFGSPSHQHRLGIRTDPETGETRRTGATLDAAVIDAERKGGALNPDWVEWLMGFPIGWTDLAVDEPVELRGDPWPPDPHPEVPRIRAGRDPNRKHRLKQLGNAVVPAVAEAVGRRMLALIPLASDERSEEEGDQT